MQKYNTNPVYAFSLLILLGFIWGTGYSIARFATTHGVSPLGYSFWQSLGPAIVVTLINLYKKSQVQFSLKQGRFYLITGLTGIVIPNTSMYFAASHLPANILAIIVNTVPIIAYPLALLAGLELFNWQRFIGILLAFGGLLLIIIPKTSLPSPQLVPWVLTTLITPLSFAFCSIFIAYCRPQKSESLSLTSGMLLASTSLLVPLILFSHDFYGFHYPLNVADGIVILEIILSSIGYILFFQLIRLAGPVFYSLVDSVVVLTGIFWGYIIFHERLNQWSLAAVFLILWALLLVTSQQRKAVAWKKSL